MKLINPFKTIHNNTNQLYYMSLLRKIIDKIVDEIIAIFELKKLYPISVS